MRGFSQGMSKCQRMVINANSLVGRSLNISMTIAHMTEGAYFVMGLYDGGILSEAIRRKKDQLERREAARLYESYPRRSVFQRMIKTSAPFINLGKRIKTIVAIYQLLPIFSSPPSVVHTSTIVLLSLCLSISKRSTDQQQFFCAFEKYTDSVGNMFLKCHGPIPIGFSFFFYSPMFYSIMSRMFSNNRLLPPPIYSSMWNINQSPMKFFKFPCNM